MEHEGSLKAWVIIHPPLKVARAAVIAAVFVGRVFIDKEMCKAVVPYFTVVKICLYKNVLVI